MAAVPTGYYSYEAITRSWLSLLIYRGVPKSFINPFLKQQGLIKGSPLAPPGSKWNCSHRFYQATLAATSASNIYFDEQDCEDLLDILVAQYSELNRNQLYLHPSKFIPASAFSSIEPVTFDTVEELQASRNGLKLSHNACLLAQNRHIMKHFDVQGKGALFSVDVESYEHEHSIILEIGWATVIWSKADDDSVDRDVEAHHYLIQEALHYSNGQYTPNNRNHFEFGRSKTLPERKVVAKMAETISKLAEKQPVILIAHSASSEISYFKTLGLDTSNWQTGFPKINLDRPAEEAANISLQDGSVYVIDTQKLFAASGTPGALPQTGLAKVLRAMQIPARRLHNAGNDAYYTLAVYEALAGTGVLRADLIDLEANRTKQEQINRRRDLATNGWSA